MPLCSQEPQGDEMCYCGAGRNCKSTVHNIPKNYLKWAVEGTVKRTKKKKPIELFGILKNIKLDPMGAKNLTKEVEEW